MQPDTKYAESGDVRVTYLAENGVTVEDLTDVTQAPTACR